MVNPKHTGARKQSGFSCREPQGSLLRLMLGRVVHSGLLLTANLFGKKRQRRGRLFYI